jgi:hypothetical protein
MSIGMTSPPPVQLAGLEELTNAGSLKALLGPIVGIELEPLPTVGYSGSRHRRMRVTRVGAGELRLVLKLTSATSDWVHRMSDARRCREADLLRTAELAGIWSVFACPYIAFAEQGPETGLLMHDLGAHLLPEGRDPIGQEEEDLLLRSLARMHALFWARTLPSVAWMAKLETFHTLIGPNLVGHSFETLLPEGLRAPVITGWREALARAPTRVAALLRTPTAERLQVWRQLPNTVVHGDARLANFAVLPGQRVSAFDWALIGWAPASVDLGWYIAVNASRLARPREQVIAAYRAALEMQLGLPFSPVEWKAFEDSAIEVGARMRLWARANGLVAGLPGARPEWEWWIERLGQVG